MRRGAGLALVGLLALAGCGSGSGASPTASPSSAAPAASAAPSAADASAGGSLADQLKDLGYQRTMTGHYFANELNREVTIEDWKPTADTSLPTVHTTEARPGEPGKPAVSEVSYDSGVAGYKRFWCVPVAQFAFNPANVVDQAEVAKQAVESGQAQPGPGQNDTRTLVSVDGSVTCYMK
jgi:hypothetical protein